MSEIFEDEVARQILRAFTSETDRWRTLGGISRESGLSVQEIEAFVEQHPDVFEVAPVRPNGEPLFGLREPLRAPAEATP